MTLEEFREAFEGFHAASLAQALEAKDVMRHCFELAALYRKFDDAERAFAAIVIGDWLDRDDQDLWFDARFLISDFRIVAAAPALKRLAARLADAEDAPRRHELLAVRRLLRTLGEN
jgi:hypothetical protein